MQSVVPKILQILEDHEEEKRKIRGTACKGDDWMAIVNNLLEVSGLVDFEEHIRTAMTTYYKQDIQDEAGGGLQLLWQGDKGA